MNEILASNKSTNTLATSRARSRARSTVKQNSFLRMVKNYAKVIDSRESTYRLALDLTAFDIPTLLAAAFRNFWNFLEAAWEAGIGTFMVFAAPKKCNNGIDDDNDGLVDYPNDPGCSSTQDNDEHSSALVCDNGIDETNDADTLKDYQLSGGDAGCSSATDNDERDGPCDDLSDNDGDGLIDKPNDPECTSFASKEGNCVDSDGGVVLTVQGTASGSTGGTPYSLTDFCLDSVNLREYACNFVGQPYSGDNSCNATGCVSGACV